MNHPYRAAKLITLNRIPDGQLVMLTGTCQHSQLGMTLADRTGELAMIGEPFDWLPGHGQLMDAWGQLIQASHPRLLLHDARPTGDTSRVPVWIKPRPEGFVGTLRVRVVTSGLHSVAHTPQRQVYLLDQIIQPDGMYRLHGRLVGLSPPLLQVLSALPEPAPLLCPPTDCPRRTS